MRVPAKRTAVAIALALVAALPAAVLAQGECAPGRAMLEAGLLDEAREWASTAEVEDPCLDELLAAIAARRGEAVALLEQAEIALDDEDEEAARELLAEALALDSGLAAARELLTQSLGLGPSPTPTPSPTPGPYAGARALADGGFTADAKEAMAKSAEGGVAIPSDLRYLGDTPWPLLPLLGILPAGVVALIPAALLTAIVLILLGPWLWVRFARERFHVEDLVGGEEAAEAGKEVAAMIEDGLRQAKHEGGGNSLSLVPAPDPEIKLPDEVESLPYGKFVGVALNLLVPPRLSRLQGRLHVADGRVTGATGSLVTPRNSVKDSVAIWLSDYESPPVPLGATTPDEKSAKEAHLAVQTLAVAIGAWALFALPVDKGAEKKRAILTPDWQSLASMRVGALYHQTDQARARDLYVRAVHFDAANTGALFNLGWLDMAAGEWARAASRLEETLARVEDKNSMAAVANDEDRLWYRCSYNLAAARFHQWLGARGKAELLTSARTLAAATAAAALSAREPAPSGSLRGFLTLVAQASLVLLADTMAATPPEPGNRKPRKPTTPVGMAAALTDPPESGSNARLHWPSSRTIIQYVLEYEAQTFGLAHRVRYNLACYYAQRGHVLLAFAALDYAFEYGELLDYAERDPSLEPIRDEEEHRPKWDELKRKHGGENSPDPYAQWWTKPGR